MERQPARKETRVLSGAPAARSPQAVDGNAKTVAAPETKGAAMAASVEPVRKTPAASDAPAAPQSPLPPITVGGFIREDGSSGLVMVNERLVREGDEVLPGLKVEKIHNESVVFNYKGQRFVR
jgi:general secretion pathway protein B